MRIALFSNIKEIWCSKEINAADNKNEHVYNFHFTDQLYHLSKSNYRKWPSIAEVCLTCRATDKQGGAKA